MQDLNDLYYFVQAVDHGGFAPAGRVLGMPKSKLSRRIAKLDETLAGLAPDSRQAAQLRQEKDEIERYLKDRRENWRDAHFEAAPQATTRLVLAIEGV